MGVRFDFRMPGSLDFTGLLENSILIAVANEKDLNHVPLTPFCAGFMPFYAVLRHFFISFTYPAIRA